MLKCKLHMPIKFCVTLSYDFSDPPPLDFKDLGFKSDVLFEWPLTYAIKEWLILQRSRFQLYVCFLEHKAHTCRCFNLRKVENLSD